jgi:Flp pilus assembly protein TadG
MKVITASDLRRLPYKERAYTNRPWRNHEAHHGERGVTMIFVALAMVAIIAMAALSIDVITLYLAKEEAQRSADAAALAAARVLSLSGVTGDPDNTQGSLPSAPWQAAWRNRTRSAVQ